MQPYITSANYSIFALENRGHIHDYPFKYFWVILFWENTSLSAFNIHKHLDILIKYCSFPNIDETIETYNVR